MPKPRLLANPRTSLPARVAAVAAIAAVAAAVTAATPEPDRGDTWAEARAAGAGVVKVLYVPSNGWAYERDGRLTGVTVEIMLLFAAHVRERHGVDLTMRFEAEPDWRTFYGRVRDADGGVFGLGNVTITDARREELAFSPPYLTNVAALITRDDVPELARFQDLPVTFSGLDALAFEGTLHEDRLRNIRRRFFQDAGIALATSNAEILDRVAAGGFFAYIDAYNFHAARAAGAPIRNHPVADDAAEEFGIIMPRDSDWVAVLAAFFEDGPGLHRIAAYRRLLVDHLGAELADMLLAAADR